VLENLLCTRIPDPPPNAPPALDPVDGGGSIRQQEEALRSSDYCQGCHSSMDPIGYVLYGYDAIGAVRTEDELGYPIDTNVTIDGTDVGTPAELSAWVAQDPRLAECIAEITMTYATGRGMRMNGDSPDGDDVAAAVVQFPTATDLTFAGLVSAVVTSEPFLYRGTPPLDDDDEDDDDQETTTCQ
jgi:hypothetical protein